MATYNIDKITLPNGDVCNLDSASISENLLVNGGPEVVNGVAANYSPYSWQYYTNSPQVVDSMAVEKDCITFNVVLASGAYFQLQKIGSYSRTSGVSGVFGGLMLYDLNDGDKITLSFEYKCGFGIGYIPRLWAQEDSTSTDLQVFLTASDTPIELSSANDWTKVTYTGTIPEGWTHAMSVLYSIGHLYRLHLVFNFIPHNTGNFYIRHIKLNRGEVATEYNANPLSRLHQIGAGGSYIGARNCALIKNMGNQFAAGSSGFFPVSGVKSDTGFWVSGCTGDKYQFSYLTDANYAANNNYAEIYSLPAPDSAVSEIKNYDILTTKNVTVDEWTKDDFSISNMAISNTNIYGTTIYITGVCDITVLNLSGPINGSWSWGSEKTIFTINSSLSSSNPKKYNAFYGGSAQAAASYGTNGSATFYKHGNGTTIGCAISANPSAGQYVQGQIVLVHLCS